MIKIYKALLQCEVLVKGLVKEYENGEIEIIELDEIEEILDLEDVNAL